LTWITKIGLFLDVVPGLVGLFGLGELFLGKRSRGRMFLLWSAGLYLAIFFSFFVPDASYLRFLPLAWGAGYLLLLLDILYITRWSKSKTKRAVPRAGQPNFPIPLS
jgi:hypothetical protein